MTPKKIRLEKNYAKRVGNSSIKVPSRLVSQVSIEFQKMGNHTKSHQALCNTVTIAPLEDNDNRLRNSLMLATIY